VFINGVSVVAALVGGVPYGMSIAWATQVEEKHLIVSLPRHSFATERLLTVGCFTVNILADSQRELAVKFGSVKEPGYKFEGVDYAIEGEAVVIADCHKAIFCELESTKEIKKQLVVVGLVKNLTLSSSSASPLIYKKSDYFSD
jgi:flavin reductase (DIM6/NTAB) family NADH-FMN oxidoreductase RutF